MFSIITAVIFSVLILLNIALVFGAPLGELTMGGQNRVLPKPLRIAAALSLLGQVFAVILILQGGGYLSLWFSVAITRILCYCFSGFFALNTLMDACSKSKKERYLMTPLSLIVTVCFFITAVRL